MGRGNSISLTPNLPLCIPSLAVLPKDLHQLFDLLVTVLGTATLDRLANTSLDVLFQDNLADFVECSGRGRQLHQNIDAVFLILDHTTNRVDLSDDTSKSILELFFFRLKAFVGTFDRLAF